MYLPFSKSIWRSSDSLDYLEKIIVKNAVGVEGGFINYREAIKRYPEEEINKWHTSTFPILEKLSEEKKKQ